MIAQLTNIAILIPISVIISAKNIQHIGPIDIVYENKKTKNNMIVMYFTQKW